MMFDTLPLAVELILGFVFGFVVSLLNHFLATPAIQRWMKRGTPPDSEPQIPGGLAFRYLARYLTYVLALYLVYWLGGSPAVLIATGLGLLTMRNYFLVTQLSGGKEG